MSDDVDDIYLIWSNEHRGWWGPVEGGYVTQASRAGRYKREHELDICARAIPGTAERMGMLPEVPVRVADLADMLEAFDTKYPARNREAWE